MSQNTTSWPGKSTSYKYWFLPSLDPSRIKDEPGNYIMAKPLENGRWKAIYVGSTPNGGTLQSRLPSHEKWEAAQKLGATTIWTHTNHNAAARSAEEQDLIANLNPPLNVQHRTKPVALRRRFL